ncbi:MAG: hypothetical protein V4665_02995 [Patescibacteria group bacterium]
MTRNAIITIILAVIVIGAILIWSNKKDVVDLEKTNDQGQVTDINNNVSNNNGSTVLSESESAVRTKVIEFGQKLKNVSILAADYQNQVQVQYGSYVSPSLIADWKADSKLALGRSTSSPWPDRIEITKVTKKNDTTYTVEGNVIEVTMDKQATPTAMYGVTLTVQKLNGAWYINAVTKGPYNQSVSSTEPVSVDGVWECLPHKVTTGPQTMECAFGIKAATGDVHYALNLGSFEGSFNTTPTNARIHVEGTLIPQNASNASMWEKYAIKGIIQVTSIKRL